MLPLARARTVLLRCSAEIPVVSPCLLSTVMVKAVPRGASFEATIGDKCSRLASSAVTGTQTMPQQCLMMNAIFSVVQSEAAQTRSPSFSRSSSSVTMTISPRAMASMACVTEVWAAAFWLTGWAMGDKLCFSAMQTMGEARPRTVCQINRRARRDRRRLEVRQARPAETTPASPPRERSASVKPSRAL